MRLDEFGPALLEQYNTFINASDKKSTREHVLYLNPSLEKIQVTVSLKKIYAPVSHKVRGITARITTEPKNFKVSMVADKVFEDLIKEANDVALSEIIYD